MDHMDMLLPPVPEEKSRGWKVCVDGQEVDARHVRIEHPKMGLALEYGWRGGYDGIVRREPGGGGSVAIPYYEQDGQIYVGVVLENRSNMGGWVYSAMGGFKDIGESHLDAATRETLEESGIDLDKPTLLPGRPVNDNRAFTVADPSRDEGIHFYTKELPSHQFMPSNEEGREAACVPKNPDIFKSLLAKVVRKDGDQEICILYFIPIIDALLEADGMIRQGAAALLVHLGHV